MAEFQLVTYKDEKSGLQFEVMAKPEATLAWRKAGCNGDALALLEVDHIYSNQSMAQKAADDELEKAFGSAEAAVCARVILEKGDIQYTAAEREALGITA